MKTQLLIFSLLFTLTISFGQNLKILTEETEDGGYKFYCENKTFSNYIVTIDFTILTNFRASTSLPFKGTANPGNTYLFSLTKTGTHAPTSFRYNTSFREGCIDPQIKDIVYLLPVAPGKSTEFITFKYLGENFGISNPKDWYAMGFKVEEGDTIYSARRGYIVDIKESFEAKYESIGFS